VSVEHTIAFDDEEYPEGSPNPLDEWDDLEEIPEEEPWQDVDDSTTTEK